jgi:hypothetical protein
VEQQPESLNPLPIDIDCEMVEEELKEERDIVNS